MSRVFDWTMREPCAGRLISLAALILVLGLAGCDREMHHRALKPSATAVEGELHANVRVRVHGSVPGFHVNAAALQLRIDAPDVPEYAIRLPVTTLDNRVTVSAGAARTLRLEVESQWGLAIYQSRPQTIDLAADENRELWFHLERIETILPLVSALTLYPERETILVVEEADSPVQDLRLIIPGHATTQPLSVSIDEVYHAKHVPAPERQVSVIIDIQPHSVRLAHLATLTLPYYRTLVSRLQLPESHLRISRFVTSKQQWQPLARQVIQPHDNTVTAQLDQFGFFALTAGDEPTSELLAIFDDREVVEAAGWSNERVTLTLRPYRRGPIGIMLRYRDMQTHYRFVWELSSHRAQFVKHYRGHRTVLASATLPYLASQAYAIDMVTEADTMAISVGGKLIFDVRNSDIPSGTVALHCASEAAWCFDRVRVE